MNNTVKSAALRHSTCVPLRTPTEVCRSWLCLILPAMLYVVSLATFSQPAHSQPQKTSQKPSVGILGLLVEDSGEGVNQEAAELSRVVTMQLRAHANNADSPYKAESRANRDFLELKLLFGCAEERPACIAAIGKDLLVDYLVFGRITQIGQTYRISLALFDIEKQGIIRTTSGSVSNRATSYEKNMETNKLLEQVLDMELTGSIYIVRDKQTINKTADIYVDGIYAGTAHPGISPTILQKVTVGNHSLRVTSQGYSSWQTRLNVQNQLVTKVTPVLIPQTQRKAKSRSPNQHWRTLFWVGAGVTAATAAGGILSGLRVNGSLQDKKTESLLALQQNEGITISSSDACGDAKTMNTAAPSTGLQAVVDACNKGQSAAVLTNTLFGTSAVVAIATSIFYYKGYIASGRKQEVRSAAKATRLQWFPQVTPTTVGGGLTLSF